MKKMFMDGFTTEEIAIAYKIDEDFIKDITQALVQPDRI